MEGSILRVIDGFIQSIPMYRFVVWILVVSSVVSFAFAFFGILPFSPLAMAISLVILCGVSFVSNAVFARLFGAIPNHDSFLISALILFFILDPPRDATDAIILVIASVLAMASKFVIAIRKAHIANPVAISLVILGAFGVGNAMWWAGSAVLLPFFALFGLLLVRKIQRIDMVITFLCFALLSKVLTYAGNNAFSSELLKEFFLSWPVIFFGTIMLTEPLTTPGRRHERIAYGALVGVFLGSQVSFGPFFASPELALVMGNVVSFLMGSQQTVLLRLKNKSKIGSDLYEYIFDRPRSFQFLPGQYMEWTLPHVAFDARGNRRYLSLASSPTEDTIRFAVKIPSSRPSAFKRRLMHMSIGDMIVAHHLSGDFLLPNSASKKLGFIAGGIGITPFRSMVKYLIDTHQSRNIVLFYSAKSPEEFAYRDVFDQAKEYGVQTIYSITDERYAGDWREERGRIDKTMIQTQCPDYSERLWYVSGPHGMVDASVAVLKSLGVRRIMKDYFPGY